MSRAYRIFCCLPVVLAAHAEPPVLPASAFVAPQSCRLDPYGETSLEQREQQLDRACGRDRFDLQVDGSRVQPDAVATKPPKLEVNELLSRNDGPLASSLRLGLSASLDDKAGRVQAERALFAAGSQLRLSDDWALDMNVGRDVGGGLPTRATFSGLWRPWRENMLFAQLAPQSAGVAGTLGMRWWVVPRRLVLDVAARRSADGQTIEPRVGVSVIDFGR